MNVRATLVWIKSDERAPLYYKACPLPNSNKKVEPNDNGNGKPWYCAGLNKYFDSYIPRFILSVALCDTTSSQFVSVFDEEGKKILGCDASDIEALREKDDQSTMKYVFDDALYKRYIFKIKASEDTYGDDSRVRLQVHTCEAIDYERESQTLLNEIDAMM
jgi:replication factor A1